MAFACLASVCRIMVSFLICHNISSLWHAIDIDLLRRFAVPDGLKGFFGRIFCATALILSLFVVCRLLPSRTFAFGLGGLAIRFVSGQQQLAQGLEIAPQDAQTNVTLVSRLAAIPATLQAVAGLQGADR